MAKAFPNSRFFGFDYHAESIRGAQESAARQGLGDHAFFQMSKSKDFTGENYDLVCVFDSLHDMGDPVGAAGMCGSAWLRTAPG